MLLLIDPTLFALLCGLLGLAVGSFLNVVVHRVPKIMEREWQDQCAEVRGEAQPEGPRITLARPRSRCPSCGHAVAARDNIPVVSYLLLRGRCRHCHSAISVRYPLVEGLTAGLSAFAAWHFGASWQAAGALLFLWAMIPLALIDFDTQLLPDSITLPLVWLGLLFNLFGIFVDLPTAVAGAMAGYLSLWIVYWIFKLVTGKEGMGYGDFKLLAAIGAWLGWQALPLTILLSSLVGAVVGIGLMVLARHGRNVPIPFGPYLAIAGIIGLLWGRSLTEAYLQLL